MGESVGAIASIGATIAGTAFQAVGAAQQAKATASQAKYQQKIAKNNQAIAEQKAVDAEKRGEAEVLRQRRRTLALAGRQKAIFAANGVDIGSDTVDMTLQDTFNVGEADAMTIRENSKREALGYRSEGMNYQAEAGLAAKRSKTAEREALWGVGGSIFDGATDVASKWYSFDREGVFG